MQFTEEKAKNDFDMSTLKEEELAMEDNSGGCRVTWQEQRKYITHIYCVGEDILGSVNLSATAWIS